MSILTSVVNHFAKPKEGFITTLSSTIGVAAATVPLTSTSGLTNGDIFVGIVDPTTSAKQAFTGTVDTAGNQITGVVWTEGTNVAHTVGATVVDYVSATTVGMITKGILVEHAQAGTHSAALITSRTEDTSPDVTNDFLLTYDTSAAALKKVKTTYLGITPTGSIQPYAGRTAPADWLLCYGQNVSRSTYLNLFNIISPSVGTFTTTIAAPGVVTLASHGMITGDQVYLTTTGALPTGLTANTLYYVVSIDASTFNLATSRANAVAGTKITTTGTQSGVHTLYWCPNGLGDGSTTFTLPDLRGRVIAGADAMGGTAAARLNLAQTQGTYGQVGASGGEQGHTQTIAEIATHTHIQDSHFHQQNIANTGGGGTGISGTASIQGNSGSTQDTAGKVATNQNTGSSTAFNVVQPTVVLNYIIRI